MIRALAALVLSLAAAQAAADSVVLYSHADTEHARRAYGLARAYGPVLIDTGLAPGAPWRRTIARAICSADVVLVVWSARAAASIEVGREIETGRACRALMVPVLLDDTPLPPGLAETQGVDWR